MHTLTKNAYAIAICLSALAGFIDVIGFLQLGRYFISFMSGNSTQLAVGLVMGNRAVPLLAGIIIFFVIGAMLGALAHYKSKAASKAVAVLMLVTSLLAGAGMSFEMGWQLPTIMFMTLAMGAENAVFMRDGDVQVGLTYMTGALVKIGQRLARALTGGEKFAWVPYLFLWVGLITGGITGTLLFRAFGLHSLWIAVAWAASITLAARVTEGSLP